jgi:hypothetical protein
MAVGPHVNSANHPVSRSVAAVRIQLLVCHAVLSDTVRILLADDHPSFTKLVESLLDSTFEVVGKVGDGRALFDAAL